MQRMNGFSSDDFFKTVWQAPKDESEKEETSENKTKEDSDSKSDETNE